VVRWCALVVVTVIAAACGRTGIVAGHYGDGGKLDDPFDDDDDDSDDEPPEPVDCDKVDFLFVIDNSASMFDHHRELVDSVDTFTEGIEQVIDRKTDLHVGVVTTDTYSGNDDECKVLGGLVTATSGAHSSEMRCGPFAEGNYMTEADDIATDFACAAMVGTQGSDIERPMDAMIAAIDDYGSAAECNAGFLRSDALLVVIMVTDEWDGPGDPEDSGSQTGADEWRKALVDAKGSTDAVVFVALVNETARQCSPHHERNDGTPLVEFAESLPFGFTGSVCEDYGATFDEALQVVAAACSGE
jgi:hypothetical protein